MVLWSSEATAASYLDIHPSEKQSKTEEMDVKIISEELVEPSSPTPQHLKTFKLSLLDQFMQASYGRIILFYLMTLEQRPFELLKRSLPMALACFYPLAGRVQNDSSIECDDQGARFIVASVAMPLRKYLSVPDLIFINKLIPSEVLPQVARATNIQVNVFECGGIAFGTKTTHKLLDGAGVTRFLEVWAAISRSGGTMAGTVPVRDLSALAELFPARKSLLSQSSNEHIIKVGNCFTQRFVFNAIEALRARGASPTVKNPTQIEAVSGFLWKCLMAATEKKDGFRRPSLFRHKVDIRQKMKIPEFSLGNHLWGVVAAHGNNTGNGHSDDVLPSLVVKLRESIASIDENFISGLRRYNMSLISRSLEELSGVGIQGGVPEYYLCSSWLKIGIYNVDFGWGRHMWVWLIGFSGPPFANLIIYLMDTRSGDGIEAILTLEEHVMDLFKQDPELRSLASVNPSALVISGGNP